MQKLCKSGRTDSWTVFNFIKTKMRYSIISIIYIIKYIILILTRKLKTETVQLSVCPLHKKDSALLYCRTESLSIRNTLNFLFNLLHDGLESLRVIHGEIGKHLAVDFDTSLVEGTHQLRIAHTLDAGSCIDTLNPKGAECALLVLAITVCIGETFLVGVLGNGPNVLTCAKVAACKFQDSLSLCS